MIALETHDGVTGITKRCKLLIEMIGSKNIGINYDPENVIYYQGLRPEKDIIDAPPKYLKHFHLKDKIGGKGEYNFPAIGEGNIDFVKIIMEKEPPDWKNLLVKLGNLIISPHISFYSEESYVELKTNTAKLVLSILKRRLPWAMVNPHVIRKNNDGKEMFL